MNLTKTEDVPAWESLKVGDPWTFVSLTPEQMRRATEAGIGGHTSRWYSTAEPGRIFRTVRIHHDINAVETVYVGFQPIEQPDYTEMSLRPQEGA